jgi:hypothetical protein
VIGYDNNSSTPGKDAFFDFLNVEATRTQGSERASGHGAKNIFESRSFLTCSLVHSLVWFGSQCFPLLGTFRLHCRFTSMLAQSLLDREPLLLLSLFGGGPSRVNDLSIPRTLKSLLKTRLSALTSSAFREGAGHRFGVGPLGRAPSPCSCDYVHSTQLAPFSCAVLSQVDGHS